MATSTTTTVAVKVSFNDDLRRFRFDTSNATHATLLAQLKELFQLPAAANPVVKYSDADGDAITLATDRDLVEALASLSGDQPLRLTMSRRVPKGAAHPTPTAPVAAVAAAVEAAAASASAATTAAPATTTTTTTAAATTPAVPAAAVTVPLRRLNPSTPASALAEDRARLQALHDRLRSERMAFHEQLRELRGAGHQPLSRDEIHAMKKRFREQIGSLKLQAHELKAKIQLEVRAAKSVAKELDKADRKAPADTASTPGGAAADASASAGAGAGAGAEDDNSDEFGDCDEFGDEDDFGGRRHRHWHGHFGHGPHGFGHGPHGFGHGPHGFGPHGHGPHGFGPHGHGPHGFGPHGHGPHGFGPHGHGPHGHGPHGHGPHGFGPHGHGPHGHGPHGHGPHGHGPHGHGPHGHGFGPHGDGCSRMVARFVKSTVEDGVELLPGTGFTQSWRFRNDGDEAWPAGTRLVLISRHSDDLGCAADVSVADGAAVQPGAEVDVSAELKAPPAAGRYLAYWRLCSPEGRRFGQRVWCAVMVQADSASAEDDSSGDSPAVEPATASTDPMAAALAKLAVVGFGDRELNTKLLARYGCDERGIQKTLRKLVHRERKQAKMVAKFKPKMA